MRAHFLPKARLSEAQHLALLCLAALVCYGNAFGGSFQFDDYNVIVNNDYVHSWQAWFFHLRHSIRPLLNFTYTLNWTLGNGDVFYFHLTNLLFHCINAVLVYCLSMEFVRRLPQRNALHGVPLFAALLFVVHPAHTEAVTYISGRSTELMTLFYLSALLAYAKGQSQHRKMYLYGATPLLFALALSVKETAVTFPLALLVWELFCGGNWKAAFKMQWPCWVLLLVGACFFLAIPNYMALMTSSMTAHTFSENFATQLSAYAWLMRQWASPRWLNIDPDLPHLQTPPLMSSLFFLGICTAILWFRRRRPWVAFALAWSVAHLFVLYVLLPRADIANERELYLASWPLLLALCCECALHFNARNFHRVAVLFVVVLATLTIMRNFDYRNEIALWESTVRLSPNKARVHNNLGYAYWLARRGDDARREFNAALKLEPDNVKAKNNLRELK